MQKLESIKWVKLLHDFRNYIGQNLPVLNESVPLIQSLIYTDSFLPDLILKSYVIQIRHDKNHADLIKKAGLIKTTPHPGYFPENFSNF